MPANINSMVYAGDVPWHGLGKQLPANASYEQIVADAGFYTVDEKRLTIAGTNIEIPDKKVLVRNDTGAPLSVVSDSYKVVQFEAVANALVRAAGNVGAIFHTAGTLGPEGARGWLLAELPNPIRVKGDSSEIRKYLLGTAAHDGHHGVCMKNCATRVVCQNTLGAALREDSKFHVAIWHTTNAHKMLEDAIKGFQEMAQGFDKFQTLANVLVSTKFSDAQMLATVDELMPVKEDAEPTKSQKEKRDRVLSLFEVGTGIDGDIRGTAWAAFQAWTEYADHQRVTRKPLTAEQKLDSVWFGTGASMKQDALDAIATQSGIQLYAA